VKVQRIEKEEQVKVQEAEIARREKELAATVQKAAEAERRRIETLAEAERQRLALEAAGRAEAQRAQGQAQAEITRLQGTAEAEIISAKGQAEAAAMSQKAHAYSEYSQAAVLDKLLQGLPELARAFAEPLAKVDKITIVSTGDGDGALGSSQVTRDLARMIAQTPALFETLTGMKVSDLMARLPGIQPGVGQPTENGGTAIAPRGDAQG
jgi:flotillin